VKFDSANSIESTCNAPKTAGRLRRGALRAQAGSFVVQLLKFPLGFLSMCYPYPSIR
jgi:hypothetical protein